MLKPRKAFAIVLIFAMVFSVMNFGMMANADWTSPEGNTVPNPGFEGGPGSIDGVYDSYKSSLQVTNEYKRSGNYSLKVTAGSPDPRWSSINFYPTEQAKTFYYSFWYMTTTDLDASLVDKIDIKIQFHCKARPGDNDVTSPARLKGDGVWYQISGIFSFDDYDVDVVEETKIVIMTDRFGVDDPPSIVYYDDFEIIPIPDSTPTPEPTPIPGVKQNAIPDAGFESIAADATDVVVGKGGGAASVVRADGVSHRGTSSLKMTTAASGVSYPFFQIKFKPGAITWEQGKQYGWSYWAYSDNSSDITLNSRFRHNLNRESGTVDYIQDTTFQVGNNRGWVNHFGVGTVAADGVIEASDTTYGAAKCYIQSPNNITGADVYYDDMYFYKLDEPAAAIHSQPADDSVVSDPVSSVDITFNYPIRPSTFTTSNVTVTGAEVADIELEEGSHTATINFAEPVTAGSVTISLSSGVTDLFGRTLTADDISFTVGNDEPEPTPEPEQDPEPTAPPVPGNLLPNQGFEEPLEGFGYGSSRASYARTRKYLYEGSYSLAVTPSDPNDVQYTCVKFPLSDGSAKRYTLSVWYMTDESHPWPEQNRIYPSLDYQRYDDTYSRSQVGVQPQSEKFKADGVWYNYTVTFTVPEDCKTLLTINLMENGYKNATDARGTVYYDNVSLVAVPTQKVNFKVYGNGTVDGVDLTDGVGSADVFTDEGKTFNFTAGAGSVLETMVVNGEIVDFIAPSYTVPPYEGDDPPEIDIELYFVDVSGEPSVTTSTEGEAEMEYYGISDDDPSENFIQVLASTNVNGDEYEYGIAYSLRPDYGDEVLYRAYGRGSTGLYIVKLVNGSGNTILPGGTYYARAYVKNLSTGVVTYSGTVVTIVINNE